MKVALLPLVTSPDGTENAIVVDGTGNAKRTNLLAWATAQLASAKTAALAAITAAQTTAVNAVTAAQATATTAINALIATAQGYANAAASSATAAATSSKSGPPATAFPSARPSHAPFWTETPFMSTSREAIVTSPVLTSSRTSFIAAALSAAGWSGSNASIAAKPAGSESVGTTVTGLSARPAA